MMLSLTINTQAAGYTIALAPQVAHLTPILIMILNYSQESGQISRGNRQPTCAKSIYLRCLRFSIKSECIGSRTTDGPECYQTIKRVLGE